ncbi:hypothetical protein EV179_006379, partial [Coemansia sp. RSA 487]
MKEEHKSVDTNDSLELFDNFLEDTIYKKHILKGQLPQKHMNLLQEAEFCHNDLHTANIIITDRNTFDLKVIDWELGGYYPPAWEYYKYKHFKHMGAEWKYIVTDYSMPKPSAQCNAMYRFVYANNIYKDAESDLTM